jgi:hypothetical protein
MLFFVNTLINVIANNTIRKQINFSSLEKLNLSCFLSAIYVIGKNINDKRTDPPNAIEYAFADIGKIITIKITDAIYMANDLTYFICHPLFSIPSIPSWPIA